MTCPFCGHKEDRVIDSRESKEGDSIRRRRQCLECERRFTTYERTDEVPYMAIKKDGRREKFDRQKVLNGLLRACEKRPVPISKLEQIVNESETFVMESPERERKTSELGELIMSRLRRYDKVAYVRFASVYLDFKDIKEFMNELKDLVKAKTPYPLSRADGAEDNRFMAHKVTLIPGDGIGPEVIEEADRALRRPLRRLRAPPQRLRRSRSNGPRPLRYGRTVTITTSCDPTVAWNPPAIVPTSLCCHKSRTLALSLSGYPISCHATLIGAAPVPRLNRITARPPSASGRDHTSRSPSFRIR